MKLARLNGRWRSQYLLLGLGVWTLGAVVLVGCFPPGQTPPGGNQGRPLPGPLVTINAPTIQADVRQGDGLIVSYDVTSPDGSQIELSLYYDVDGQANTNDEVLVATGLDVGSTFYTIDTSTIPPGRYHILLDARDDRGRQTLRYAQGVMNVMGPRRVVFQAPLTDLVAGAGAGVTIRFTSGETVNYVLFFDTDGVDNGDETTIASGSGQNVTKTWVLSNISPETYFIGVRIRDGLGQTETVYAPGKVILNERPSVQVTGPDQDLEIYAGQPITVEYQVFDPDDEASVRVFIDIDRAFGNGNEIGIAPGLDEADTQYLLDTTSISPGGYFIGVAATDGINDEAHAYASGRVEVFSSTLSILFLEPTNDVSVAPGESVNVSWQVTAPSGGGTLSVLYVKLDAGDNPVGPEVAILSDAPIAPDVTTFDTTGLEEGATYQLRIRAWPTFGSPVLVTGPNVLVRSDPSVSLLEPSSSRTIGTLDRLFIKWEAVNLQGPLGAITAQMFADPDTLALNGNEIALTPVAITPTATEGTYEFSTTWDLSATPVDPGNYYLYLSVNDGGTIVGDYGSSAGVVAQGPAAAQMIIITIKPRVTGTFWMGDAGKDLTGDGKPDSIVWIGFDFYDSAGSLVAPLGDLEGDGYGDFLIVAQFAKPFRAAPVGDAYVIRGAPDRFAESLSESNVSTDPNVGILNLNSVGTTVPGILYLGPAQVPVPDAPPSGIQSAMFLPDLTGDNVGELAFGIPFVHNSQSLSASTAAGFDSTVIVRSGQLRRGGVIISTSQNQTLIQPLDQIGQTYSAGKLSDPAATERRVTNLVPGDPNTPEIHHMELTAPSQGWSHPGTQDPADNDMAGPRPVPQLHREPLNFVEDADNRYQWDTQFNPWLVDGNTDGDFDDGIPTDRCLYTGFLTGAQSGNYGSRILGDAQGHRFGAAIDWWREGLVSSSPAVDPADLTGGVPSRPGAGVVYFRRFVGSPPWAGSARPSNWVVADAGPFNHPTLGYSALIIGAAANAQLGPLASLAEAATDRAGDFNGDGLDDLAIGAPGMNGGNGAAYVFYVRLPTPYIFDLAQINEPIGSGQRRAGIQINGDPNDELGSVIPDGLDFNNDGFADAVFGNPRANDDTGEVIVLWGGTPAPSPDAGWSIADVANPDNALGLVLQGIAQGDMAGALAANAGDFDGDGIDDLVIAAPSATPRYDSNGNGYLDAGDNPGVDRNGDGNPDGDVPGDMTGAGVVYLIYGQRSSDPNTSNPFVAADEADGVRDGYVSLGRVGTSELQGAIFVGKSKGDALGGGMTTPDGVTEGSRAIGFSSAGDVDGDGRADILISSVRASPLGHTHAGEVYLIFGIAPE